ncbi:MAG: DinB family protein [Ignavibacteriae bacterium]|nr:DinB family protein [Ignavibacteriota bacterium]
MIPQTKWFDRKWEFDFPVGYFPAILERFRGTPARIEDLVKSLPAEILAVRIGEAWSIQEHIGHLLDLSDLDERRLADYLAGAERLSPADPQNKKTYEADYNSQVLQNILRDFRKSREELVWKFERLTEEQIARVAIHPRLKQSLRLVDWLYFMAEHDDHHIARMTANARILQKRG